MSWPGGSGGGRVRGDGELCQNADRVSRANRQLAGAVSPWWVAAFSIAFGFPGSWWVTDRLEQDNDFCNACHLSAEVPLHIDIRRDFDLVPAASLAGVHGAARVVRRTHDPAFRCIDCHGGHDLRSRAKVKLLAAKDAFWWLTGQFDEPDQMAWPLEDGDCAKCHADFDESDYEAWESPRFHQLAVHNVELGVDCVTCHLVHETGGKADAFFLHTGHVRSQCARCHMEYAGL